MINFSMNRTIKEKTRKGQVLNRFARILGTKNIFCKVYQYLVTINLIVKKKYGFSLEILLSYLNTYYSSPIKLRSIKIANSTYEIPFEQTIYNQESFILKELKKTITTSKGNNLKTQLIAEIGNVLKSSSILLKKREEILKKAENSSGYLHYKW